VREALIALEVEGWVEVRTGSGVYVLDRAGTAKARQSAGNVNAPTGRPPNGGRWS
jgi:DNA-binding FadR family transcriptional regulator